MRNFYVHHYVIPNPLFHDIWEFCDLAMSIFLGNTKKSFTELRAAFQT